MPVCLPSVPQLRPLSWQPRRARCSSLRLGPRRKPFRLLGPRTNQRDVSAGPVTVPAHIPAACLPRTLTALCLPSAKAVGSLADLGPGLAPALPSLRVLRMPLRPGSDWQDALSADVGRLLDALLPLASQLQVMSVGRRKCWRAACRSSPCGLAGSERATDHLPGSTAQPVPLAVFATRCPARRNRRGWSCRTGCCPTMWRTLRLWRSWWCRSRQSRALSGRGTTSYSTCGEGGWGGG